MRQGPHQAAQKSTRTGTPACSATSSNNSGSASIGAAIGSIEVLQAPHLTCFVRYGVATRFFRSQARQIRIMCSARRRSRWRGIVSRPAQQASKCQAELDDEDDHDDELQEIALRDARLIHGETVNVVECLEFFLHVAFPPIQAEPCGDEIE